jgi:hypothetical protein
MDKDQLTNFFLHNCSYLSHLIKRESIYQSSIMEPTPEILSRLKLLTLLQKGDKLCVKTMSIQPDGWNTRLSRCWIAPDNRQNTLKVSREVIGRAFEILIYNLDSKKESDIIQCKMIVQDLIKAQTGLLNLKSTYINDAKFGCDIDILIQQIVARLSEVKKENGDLFIDDPLQSLIDGKKDDNAL